MWCRKMKETNKIKFSKIDLETERIENVKMWSNIQFTILIRLLKKWKCVRDEIYF